MILRVVVYYAGKLIPKASPDYITNEGNLCCSVICNCLSSVKEISIALICLTSA